MTELGSRDDSIDVKCSDCGRLVAVFEWGRLPRGVKAALRLMADTFGGGADASADEGAPTQLPIVCLKCKGIRSTD